MPLLLAFILVPTMEIAGLALVGSLIGIWPTVGLVLLGTATGFLILRQQGFQLIRGAARGMDSGDFPVDAMVSRICIMFAGILFLIPGLVTDLIALLLLMPPVRRSLGLRLMRLFRRHGDVRVVMNGRTIDLGEPPPRPPRASEEAPPRRPPPPPAKPPVIVDVEEPPDAPSLSESRWRPPNSRFRSE